MFNGVYAFTINSGFDLFTTGHSGELSKQSLEISRPHVGLDKKKTQISAMRTRELVRKNMIRRIVKILLSLFVRSNRRYQRQVFDAALNRVTRRVEPKRALKSA